MTEDEVFYPIKDWEGYYEINRIGIIRSVERYFINSRGQKRVNKAKVIKFIKDNDGYWKANLRSVSKGKDGVIKQYRVHRLLAIQFIPNPHNFPVINHINAIRSDNRLDNLEWTTMKGNAIHKYTIGYIQHDRKLTESQVEDIYKNTRMKHGKYKQDGDTSSKDMAAKYNISVNILRRIITGVTYKEITSKFI